MGLRSLIVEKKMKKTIKMKDLKKLIKEMVDQEMTASKPYYNRSAASVLAGIGEMLEVHVVPGQESDPATSQAMADSAKLYMKMAEKKASAQDLLASVDKLAQDMEATALSPEQKSSAMKSVNQLKQIISDPSTNEIQ